MKDYTTDKTLWNTNLYVDLFLESIISLAGPNYICKSKKIVNVDIYFYTDTDLYLIKVKYCVNDFLILLLLSRVYVVFRFLLSSNRFFSDRAERVS